MAVIMSFDTMCHLEAIQRDLIEVLIDTKTIEILRRDLKERKFHDLLRLVEDEIILHKICEEIAEIAFEIELSLEEAGGC